MSKILNAGEWKATVGIKAKVGLIENPPDPRVIENAACIAPRRSGPLKDILSPACFTSSASSESEKLRLSIKVLVNVAKLHRGDAIFPLYLCNLESYRVLYVLKERRV